MYGNGPFVIPVPAFLPQGSSTWGRLLIECWLPHSMSLPSWPTLTPASPKTQQWGTRTTVSGGSSERSIMFRSSWLSLNSLCSLLYSGNLFVVQWDKVRLKDREAEGPFTFQAALHKNGTIVFNYRDVSHGFQLNCTQFYFYSSWMYFPFARRNDPNNNIIFQIPVPVEKINSTEHPVKVGLSDAFMAFLPSSQLSGQFSKRCTQLTPKCKGMYCCHCDSVVTLNVHIFLVIMRYNPHIYFNMKINIYC